MLVIDTLKLDKNIDRILPLDDNLFVVASYHLDKESQTKSGDLNVVKIKENKIELVSQLKTFDFGILSIEKEDDQGLFSLGCSDGKVRFGENVVYSPAEDNG